METDRREKPLRYCMYIRKSSEEEQAQEKSIPDQIKYCEDYAAREGLLIAKKYPPESRSAKMSNNRPIFNQMLDDIRAGKYDGILAYHPDRLARNMLEAGMIVDMVDNGVIKDLQFPTHPFTNNASGKLNLNIQFALSKQYSEHLSETVKRGTDTNLEQGKSNGTYRWGYKRNEITDWYEPDDNFDLIRKGWDMRLSGSTLDEVAEFWKSHNIHRTTKITRKNKRERIIYLDSKQTVSTIFRNPFYYGLLVQGGQEVDLRKVANFKPMITEEEFDAVQEMSLSKRKNIRNKKREEFYPLRQFVRCKHCGNYMAVGKSRNAAGKYYLYYRCSTKDCPVRNIRAHLVFDRLYEELAKLKMSAEQYDFYNDSISKFSEDKIAELRLERRSLEGAKKQKETKIKDLSRNLARLPENAPEVAKNAIIEDIEDLQNEVIDLTKEIDRLKGQIVNPDDLKTSIEEFLNLANNGENKMRAGTSVEKDILARTLLLNIEIDDKKEPVFLWNEPFKTLLESLSVNSGARERT